MTKSLVPWDSWNLFFPETVNTFHSGFDVCNAQCWARLFFFWKFSLYVILSLVTSSTRTWVIKLRTWSLQIRNSSGKSNDFIFRSKKASKKFKRCFIQETLDPYRLTQCLYIFKEKLKKNFVPFLMKRPRKDVHDSFLRFRYRIGRMFGFAWQRGQFVCSRIKST